MAGLTWDVVGQKEYETGVDRGVLYPYNKSASDSTKVYSPGVAWSGLTSISESPSGAEPTKLYADNIQYLEMRSNEEYGGTIEAYMYPDEFADLDGTAELATGVRVGQQARGMFGLSYRTRKGNDTDGTDHGYLLHLIYGATASPSEKSYETINDSPDAIQFSWDFSTTPVEVGTNLRPTSRIVIDSTKVDAAKLASLESALYGSSSGDPYLPLPSEIKTMFAVSSASVGD